MIQASHITLNDEDARVLRNAIDALIRDLESLRRSRRLDVGDAADYARARELYNSLRVNLAA